jgi:protein phosphatase
VGRRREENQDQFLIAELRKSMLVKSSSLMIDEEAPLFGLVCGQLLIVADGMGGHAAGKRASSVAMDQLIVQLLNRMHWFLQLDHDLEDDFIDALKDLLRQAHARILSEAASDDAQRGMGTTLTMAYIIWPRMYVVHAGDSRCYLIRGGHCEQLTTDHTLARQLVESGGLKPEDEEKSRWSNVLWNVLGGSGEQEFIAEVRRVDLIEGDTVLMCSDGLSRYLSRKTLAEVVSDGCGDNASICHRLVGLANAAGGEDNITVIVCKPTKTEPQDRVLDSLAASAAYGDRVTESLLNDDDDDETDLSQPSTENKAFPETFDNEDTLPG